LYGTAGGCREVDPEETASTLLLDAVDGTGWTARPVFSFSSDLTEVREGLIVLVSAGVEELVETTFELLFARDEEEAEGPDTLAVP